MGNVFRAVTNVVSGAVDAVSDLGSSIDDVIIAPVGKKFKKLLVALTSL